MSSTWHGVLLQLDYWQAAVSPQRHTHTEWRLEKGDQRRARDQLEYQLFAECDAIVSVYLLPHCIDTARAVLLRDYR